MDIFPILYLIPFFIYLYWIFFFVKDDFTLLRKNVSADQLFSLSIFGIFTLFFFSRLGYVFFNPKIIYLNPLIFLAFPYYPGFSQASGILGIYLHIAAYSKKKKLPFLRIFDIVVSSLGLAMWISVFLDFLTELIIRHTHYINFLFSGFTLLIWAVFIAYMHTKNKFHDGSVGYIGLAGISFILLVSNAISNIFFVHHNILVPENVFLLLLFLFFSGMFWRNEYNKR